MANIRRNLSSFVGKLLTKDDTDVLREGVRVLAQALMEPLLSGRRARQRRSGCDTWYVDRGDTQMGCEAVSPRRQWSTKRRSASGPRVVGRESWVVLPIFEGLTIEVTVKLLKRAVALDR